MQRTLSLLALILAASLSMALEPEAEARKAAVERGRGFVRGTPPLNPPVWSMRAYENVWKAWGLKEKPADFEQQFRSRYGLHEAAYANSGLPMGFHVSTGIFGKGVVNDCMLCHSGRVAGQMIIGLGNSSVDVQGIFDDLFAAEGNGFKFPVPVSQVRGTIDPVSPVAFLLEFRDLELDLGPSAKLPRFKNLASDPPAWWLLKKKKTRNWMGLIDANSVRVDMPNIFSPFNSGEYIRQKESAFADIHKFILGVEAPRYPFPIDSPRAAKGREIFEHSCARCHGTYGANPTYPNKIVPLATLGTDPLLARAITPDAVEHFNKSWLGREIGKDGKPIQAHLSQGYQAPPLDGIWATAPYFHNGSVPTVYHVLNSKARPRVFTRSYRAEQEDYDTAKLGWKITIVNAPQEPNMPGHQRRRIYDTTVPGQANTGHTFGDELTEDERMAVIEYLKMI